MRIFNEDAESAVDYVTLFLTETETRIMSGYLEQLLENPRSTHFTWRVLTLNNKLRLA